MRLKRDFIVKNLSLKNNYCLLEAQDYERKSKIILILNKKEALEKHLLNLLGISISGTWIKCVEITRGD